MKIHNPKLLNWTQDLPGTFYGITVKESDGSPAYKRINTVAFDRVNFYISQNSPNTDEVLVSFRGAAADTTTASNLGSGAGVFAQKVGDDLQFKSLVQGAGIKLTTAANSVTVESTVGEFYGVTVKLSSGSKAYRNINVLSFEVERFYIDQNTPNLDTVQVSFKPKENKKLYVRGRTLQAITGGAGAANVTGMTQLNLPNIDNVHLRKFRMFAQCSITNTAASEGVYQLHLWNGSNGTVADTCLMQGSFFIEAGETQGIGLGPLEWTPASSAAIKIGLGTFGSQNGNFLGGAGNEINEATLWIEEIPF